MAYDQNNIFARILRGELPCIKIYEDEHTLAFMDIMPQAEGHALVLPREPAVTLLELSPQALQTCILATRRVAAAVQRAVGAPGLLISQFNGEAAGQTVPHVHFHIIPRFEGVKLKSHGRERGDPQQLQAIAARVIAELAADGG